MMCVANNRRLIVLSSLFTQLCYALNDYKKKQNSKTIKQKKDLKLCVIFLLPPKQNERIEKQLWQTGKETGTVNTRCFHVQTAVFILYPLLIISDIS